MVWGRPALTDRYYDDIITVFGHTPSWFFGSAHEGKIIFSETWIDIDAGAASGFPPVLLRLDDMVQFSEKS
jgi:serine/threonine protein phosphatase 1